LGLIKVFSFIPALLQPSNCLNGISSEIVFQAQLKAFTDSLNQRYVDWFLRMSQTVSYGGSCCVRGGVNDAIAKAVFEQGIRHADSSTDLVRAVYQARSSIFNLG
jgi:hypothetical protein